VVDNRAGANGIIATELVARSAPDGNTLLFMSTSHTMNAAVYRLPFEPVAAFTPVMMLASGPLVLVAHPAFPANDARELIDIAKIKPNTITYAVPAPAASTILQARSSRAPPAFSSSTCRTKAARRR
jgi:tripartite-type tricarboxylate transporter receptor subunit TctC